MVDLSSRLELSTRAFPQSLFSSDEHPSSPHNRRARFTRTHQPHRTPRALVLVMADDLSNLGTCAFDPRGSRRGGFPTPNVIAHALFLSATRCRPTPAGWVWTETARGRARCENSARERHAFGDVHGFLRVSTQSRGPTVARAGTAGHRRGGAFLLGARHHRSRRRSAIPRWGRPSAVPSMAPPAHRSGDADVGARAIDVVLPSPVASPGRRGPSRASPPPSLALRPTFFLPKRTRADAHFAFPLSFRVSQDPTLTLQTTTERPLKKSSRRIPCSLGTSTSAPSSATAGNPSPRCRA